MRSHWPPTCRKTRPWLALVYLLGLFSNLGAAWPVIIVLFVASSTLGQVLQGGVSAVTIGVDGIMTDRPRLLKDVFEERGLWVEPDQLGR